jgi:hypothetical protein
VECLECRKRTSQRNGRRDNPETRRDGRKRPALLRDQGEMLTHLARFLLDRPCVEQPKAGPETGWKTGPKTGVITGLKTGLITGLSGVLPAPQVFEGPRKSDLLNGTSDFSNPRNGKIAHVNGTSRVRARAIGAVRLERFRIGLRRNPLPAAFAVARRPPSPVKGEGQKKGWFASRDFLFLSLPPSRGKVPSGAGREAEGGRCDSITLQYRYCSGLNGPVCATPIYSDCLSVSFVSFAPILSRCRRATFSSSSLGSV